MRKTPRTVKSVNFAHDGYEDDLLAYATDPARGKFGRYVKRLIERDRDAQSAPVTAVIPTSPVVKTDKDAEKRALIKGFF